MSFLQAYYTSCETGLRGGKGFQINAATPGLDPSLLQQIERLGLYVPPVDAPSRPTAEEIEQFPLSLLYQRVSDNCAVLAQAKYLGTDYSGRFGNYFTHSLVSLNPAVDIKGKGFLPIELWQSETWETRESASPSLDPLDEPRAGSAINVQAVEEFLRDKNRLEHLPAFLTTVESALRMGRRIVVVADSEAIALWIAAASYALPSHLALQLTFNTYAKNPYQSESLIVGTTADSDFKFAPHEIEHQYFVFDFQRGRFTPIPEISGFAAQVAAAYRDGRSEDVAGFSRFVEHLAPNLQLDELDIAFDCHSRISKIAVAETGAARVIKWCANYFANFSPEQMRLLLSGVMDQGSPSREVVGALTDLFLASQSGRAQPEITDIIDGPYIEWLIRDLSVSAPIEVLAETVNRLQVAPALATKVQPLRLLWMKQLRQTEEPARLCLLLQLGERLTFLGEPDEVFRHLGKIVIGPLLNDVGVQQAVTQFADRPAIREVISGVGEYLGTQISQLLVFTTLSEWLTQPEVFNILVAYASERKDLNLYFRLLGAQASRATVGSDEFLKTFRTCLAGGQLFGTALTTSHLNNAFAAVWQDRLPTLDEGGVLLDLLQTQQITDANIPRRLVDLLSVTEAGLSDPKQKALVNRLASSPIYASLGDKALAVGAFVSAGNLLRAGEDTATAIDDALHFLKQYSERLDEQTKTTIYGLMARGLAHVKDELAHQSLLMQAYSSNGGALFLRAYGQEVAGSLAQHTSAKEREVARLFRIWIATEKRTGSEPSNSLLWDVLPQALQEWRAKHLEAVDKGLLQHRTAHLRWIKWREHFREQGSFSRIKRLFTFR